MKIYTLSINGFYNKIEAKDDEQALERALEIIKKRDINLENLNIIIENDKIIGLEL